MKIVFITREGYNLSGARIRCYGFAKELEKYNIKAEVFSFADDLGSKYGEKEFEMGLMEKIKYNIRAFKKLREKLDNNSIIFMQRLNYHSLAPFLISLLKKNKFIFDCDDWNIRENPIYYFGIYPSSKMEYLTRKIAKYANICIVASRFLGAYLRKFNTKLFYIPTGVDTDIFRPQNNGNNSKITFAWIGTSYNKEMGENLRFILDCFSLLANKYDNIFLEIAGGGRYFYEVQGMFHNLKYKDRIKFSDWISPDKIPDYLSNVNIGLLPLIQDTKFNQAKSPTKLFEYMAMAKPVVSSDIGESRYIIKDGENGFLAKDKKEFMEKMRNLIEDSKLRQRMGENARQMVEKNYSLKVLGRHLYEILKTI